MTNDDYTLGYAAGWQDCLDDAAIVPCSEASDVEAKLMWMMDRKDVVAVACVGVLESGDLVYNYTGKETFKLIAGASLLKQVIMDELIND